MKYFMPALRFKLFMTLLLGLLYPFAITGISQVLFPKQSAGEFLSRGGQVLGSHWISQKFEKPEYFWPRPSAVDYNPLPSGGSNLSPASADLKKAFDERKTKLKSAHPGQSMEPPQDLLFASGSGLDPHISPEAADYQIQRVASARKMNLDQVRTLVEKATEQRQWKILGEPNVNVLALNLSLDQAQGIETAPVFVAPPVNTGSETTNQVNPTGASPAPESK